jgi:glutathione S-transferase
MVRLAIDDIRTREVLEWRGTHLLHFPMSSCSAKTRIFLNLKQAPWTSHPVDLTRSENVTAWFLGVNPRGLVPVLIHDGEVHIESNDILLRLEELFPHPCLIPSASAATIKEMLRHEDDLHFDLRNLSLRFVFNPPTPPKNADVLARYVQSGSGTVHGVADAAKAEQIEYWTNYAAYGVTDEAAREAVARFRRAFEDLDRRLMHGAYVLGDALTVLDIAWFIYVDRLMIAGYPVERLHPALGAWFEGLRARSEFAREVALPPAFQAMVERTHRQHAAEGKSLAEVAGLR